MPVTRTIWKSPFTLENVPQWTCPVCHKGILKGDKTTIKVFENEASKRAHDNENWEPEWVSGSYIGHLICNNDSCGESIASIGIMMVESDYYFDKDGQEQYTYSQFLYPKSFIPALQPFKVSEEIPSLIRTAIISSFDIYWIDTSSCGNKIRVIAERIMDDQSIPKTYIDNHKKRRSYPLHRRINFFEKIHPNEARLLMAIKWIGNFGSHQSESLTLDDLLDAYELLEHVTNSLYARKEAERIKRLSKEILKRKKPRGVRIKKKRK